MNQNFHVNKTYLHMKGFALGLALKQSWNATWKLPIILDPQAQHTVLIIHVHTTVKDWEMKLIQTNNLITKSTKKMMDGWNSEEKWDKQISQEPTLKLYWMLKYKLTQLQGRMQTAVVTGYNTYFSCSITWGTFWMRCSWLSPFAVTAITNDRSSDCQVSVDTFGSLHKWHV